MCLYDNGELRTRYNDALFEQALQRRTRKPILHQAIVDVVCFLHNPSTIRFYKELKEGRVVI